MVGSAPTQICFQINAEDDGVRLDKILAQNAPEISRARLQVLVKSGACTAIRNNKADTIKDPSWRVKLDDEIALTVPPPLETAITGENIALDILHEDDQLIVLNKPAGMVVHPAPGNREATLVNALIAHCGDTLSGIGGEKRPGIVHRLDKDTSGVMVAAKTDAAHLSLSAQFAAHGRDGEQGNGKYRVRNRAGAGPAYRTPPVSDPDRDRGQEGRHDRLCRKAGRRLEGALTRFCCHIATTGRLLTDR